MSLPFVLIDTDSFILVLPQLVPHFEITLDRVSIFLLLVLTGLLVGRQLLVVQVEQLLVVVLLSFEYRFEPKDQFLLLNTCLLVAVHAQQLVELQFGALETHERLLDLHVAETFAVAEVAQTVLAVFSIIQH